PPGRRAGGRRPGADRDRRGQGRRRRRRPRPQPHRRAGDRRPPPRGRAAAERRAVRRIGVGAVPLVREPRVLRAGLARVRRARHLV
ncbi:MAG: hypothetical protein AVDCRST_MAG85-1401, partial [uncultured Solirubrobacteraceae bacterium]